MSSSSAAVSPADASRGSCSSKRPQLRVLVVEKRQHPVREAAFKVGESSVEIGAHYFQKRLGLEPHLRSAAAREARPALLLHARRQPRPHRARRARSAAVSAGAVVPARSRAARELSARTDARAGRDVLDGCRVQIDRARRSDGASRDARRRRAARATVTARWVVDASGRAGLLKRQLGLARPSTHGANACVVPRQLARARSTTGRTTRRGRRACRRACAG